MKNKAKVKKNLAASVVSIGYRKEGGPKDPLDIYSDWVIVGTGVLISPNLVMTNRHVVNAVRHKTKHDLSLSYIFSYDSVSSPFRMIGSSAEKAYTPNFNDVDRVELPALNGLNVASPLLDIGFFYTGYDLYPNYDKNIAEFVGIENTDVGANVCACGFPFSQDTQLFEIEDPITNLRSRIHRAGPLFSFGKVSGFAPINPHWYDQVSHLDVPQVITDMSLAGGMSGSPIMNCDTNELIGVHSTSLKIGGSNSGLLGICIPLTQSRIRHLLTLAVADTNEIEIPDGQRHLDGHFSSRLTWDIVHKEPFKFPGILS